MKKAYITPSVETIIFTSEQPLLSGSNTGKQIGNSELRLQNELGDGEWLSSKKIWNQNDW